MKNFWENLSKPIVALAPMAGATDTVFRQIIAGVGKPSVMMTEFLCVDQLYSPGSKAIAQLLEYEEVERPIVAQIWGITPELFYNAAQMIVGFGFDGIDINMGCPERSVVKRGACSALIKDQKLAGEIIVATKEGAGDSIPVSVKTRIGFDKIVTEEWIGHLLSYDIQALTAHGRTTKEMSKVPCHWDEIGKVASIRNKMKSKTLIIGNGDVSSLKEANDKVSQYGVDGVMIGRGVFSNPWVFNANKKTENQTTEDRIALLKKHIELYRDTWGNEKNYSELKRFYKVYLQGFSGAAHLRNKLMQTNSFEEVLKIIINY